MKKGYNLTGWVETEVNINSLLSEISEELGHDQSLRQQVVGHEVIKGFVRVLLEERIPCDSKITGVSDYLWKRNEGEIGVYIITEDQTKLLVCLEYDKLAHGPKYEYSLDVPHRLNSDGYRIRLYHNPEENGMLVRDCQPYCFDWDMKYKEKCVNIDSEVSMLLHNIDFTSFSAKRNPEFEAMKVAEDLERYYKSIKEAWATKAELEAKRAKEKEEKEATARLREKTLERERLLANDEYEDEYYAAHGTW